MEVFECKDCKYGSNVKYNIYLHKNIKRVKKRKIQRKKSNQYKKHLDVDIVNNL